MLGNIKIKKDTLAGAEGNLLEAEVEQLRTELRHAAEQLRAERALRNRLERAVESAAVRTRAAGSDVVANFLLAGGDAVLGATRAHDGSEAENVYVFNDRDQDRAAFDDFFNAPDPHLEKVRRFLLD